MSDATSTIDPEPMAEKTEKLSESQKVLKWRLEVASDYAPPEVAELVAEAHLIDLRQWEKLVKQGCDPALALQLLSPVD